MKHKYFHQSRAVNSAHLYDARMFGLSVWQCVGPTLRV